MSLFDLLLILIIGSFALFGFWFGFIHTFGSLVGTLFGVYLASRAYVPMAKWLMAITGWNGNFSQVLMFIIAFVVINRLIGLGFHLLEREFRFIRRAPFIKRLNRLLGAAVGLLEGVIVIGISVLFINKFPLGQAFMEALSRSFVAHFCAKVALFVWPLVPESMRALKNAIF